MLLLLLLPSIREDECVCCFVAVLFITNDIGLLVILNTGNLGCDNTFPRSDPSVRACMCVFPTAARSVRLRTVLHSLTSPVHAQIRTWCGVQRCRKNYTLNSLVIHKPEQSVNVSGNTG